MTKAPMPASGDLARDEFRKKVGSRIAQVRKLYDTNRTRFAENFVKGDKGGKPIHHTTWKGWEDGNSLADIEVMVAFCAATGATLDWIYRGILDGVDEDLKLRMFEADPGLLAWYRADRASRRDPGEAGQSRGAQAAAPETQELGVPEAPKRGRRRPGKRSLSENSPA